MCLSSSTTFFSLHLHLLLRSTPHVCLKSRAWVSLVFYLRLIFHTSSLLLSWFLHWENKKSLHCLCLQPRELYRLFTLEGQRGLFLSSQSSITYLFTRHCHLSQSSRGLHLPLLKVLCTEENSTRIKVAISTLFNSTATKAHTLALHYLPHLTSSRGEQKVNLREQHNYFYLGLRIAIEDKLFRISLASTLKLRLTKPKIFKPKHTSTSC